MFVSREQDVDGVQSPGPGTEWALGSRHSPPKAPPSVMADVLLLGPLFILFIVFFYLQRLSVLERKVNLPTGGVSFTRTGGCRLGIPLLCFPKSEGWGLRVCMQSLLAWV